MCGAASAVTLGSYARVAFVEVPKVDIDAFMDAAYYNAHQNVAGLAYSSQQQMDASVLAANPADSDPFFEIILACN